VNKETRRPVENLSESLPRGEVSSGDIRFLLSKDGKELTSKTGGAHSTDTGEGFGVVLVFRDITQKKLADGRQRAEGTPAIDSGSIADGVVVAIRMGSFSSLMRRGAGPGRRCDGHDTRPNGLSYGSYLPDAVTLYPPNELPLVRAMRGESVDAVEVFIRNGKCRTAVYSALPADLSRWGCALQGGVIVFHDITLQKRAQEALVQAKESGARHQV